MPVNKGDPMKSYVAIAIVIALTGLSSTGLAAKSPEFCMKRYLSSLSLHAKASTNFYKQVGTPSPRNAGSAQDAGVNRRR